MTAPLADPYTYQSDQGLSPLEQAVIAAVAAYLATHAAVKAVTLPTVLVDRVAALGLSKRAVRAAARLTLEPALTGRTRWGSPTRRFGRQTMVRRMAAQEPTMRARYLLAAAKRLTQALLDGEFTAGLAREKRYLDLHRQAGQRRAKVARDYDRVAQRHQVLRWQAVMDRRTTPDCAARNGSTWTVDNPPPVIPGMAHPSCRCVTVPA